MVQGVVATTIARTAVDLSQRCQAGEALAVVDSALRADATVDELLALCDELEVDAGSSAREVIAIGDRLSGSALESMSRWLVHARKLPRQVSIGDDIGPFAVVDFYWREAGVIGEADGLLKYDESPDALRKEKLRQERLERLGFIVVRWTFDDVLHRPDEVVARLREALRRGLRNRARVTGMSCGWAAPTLAV